MTIRTDRVVIDTNVWIFGLRRTPAYLSCAHLLDRLSDLRVVISRQVLRELQGNLSDEELRDLFHLVNLHPTHIVLDWQWAPIELIRKYERLGCRRGDAVVAAHVEHLGIPLLVSENREFLSGVNGLPFRMLTASDALAELEQTLHP